ncbi:MAG: hypothetical protein HYS17_06225 [Micavibrio aeruginosavorus]|uniref:AbiEi antitoxin C-terminal domain-containing protein n=1 Tax=Micavibrio aeruginosavorus TaxID=349221 RepID=A0A7T5R0A1_9BACT|nr:MAG: hypothetical protein HYS17_06225 [Micavibrio aeruginosavorus]
MNITQAVESKIKALPTGQVFDYGDLPEYGRAPDAVVKAVNRLVADGMVTRLLKGKFYVPKQGVLGPRKPSDNELIRAMLYKNGRLRGYVTGIALFNRLGLTTQIPRTVTLALTNGGRQTKDFGTIRVKTISARYPVSEQDVKLLQYLDVLQDIKTIPDADINQSLKAMQRYFSELTDQDRKRLVEMADAGYGPQVRALIGLLFAALDEPSTPDLKKSLNPTTTYKLALDPAVWPDMKDWNIH